MGRIIVLLSDGTGNSAAKVWRTNVWRVFESIDLSNSEHVAYYDDGVGTSSFKPFAILGGAFGYGLKRNIIDLYKFACRNHRNPEDEIFAFGFSRGAFTIRVVIGLILEQGIIRAHSEAELDRKARAAYRDFRRRNFHTIWRFPEAVLRALRDAIIRTDYSKDKNFHSAKIRFLGLWDTVAAYGMPIEEMTRGISQWLFPLLLPRCDLDPRVVRACHALSIDDERTTFHPVLWDERNEKPLTPGADGKCHLIDERISQVWFAGVHSNVGGGYPDDSLAQIPLVWIMNEAQRAGLPFKSVPAASPQTIEHPETAQDKELGAAQWLHHLPGREYALPSQDRVDAVPRVRAQLLLVASHRVPWPELFHGWPRRERLIVDAQPTRHRNHCVALLREILPHQAPLQLEAE
jgi:uncharacterized protein (DUF2235 family)